MAKTKRVLVTLRIEVEVPTEVEASDVIINLPPTAWAITDDGSFPIIEAEQVDAEDAE